MAQSDGQYHHGDLKIAILQRAAEVIGSEGMGALSLRGIARDLGVSHGAPNRHFSNKADLLAELATTGWLGIQRATLDAADQTGSDDPRVRLNAMGKGFLRWAIDNSALFRAISHPDVSRFADDELRAAVDAFNASVKAVLVESQAAGRHPKVRTELLSLYTNSVPFGVAMMLNDPFLGIEVSDIDKDELVDQVIDLVVPLDE
jgi:AcrR family transcriptional regulator